MKTQKCCAHCPGKLIPPRSNESHDCCQPKYVTGSLKISSLRKQIPEYLERKDKESNVTQPLPESPPSWYDKFTLAKRLHAENLEHQPLPDKVDDSIFKNVKARKCCPRIATGKCSCSSHNEKREDDVERINLRFGPVLGCKKPKTRMDLAICWETPIDPIYEPRRPARIDGLDSGLAPAIFTLVRHTKNSRASLRSGAIETQDVQEKGCQYPCASQDAQDSPEFIDDETKQETEEEDRKSVRSRYCCECLCKGISGVNISKADETEDQGRKRSFRKCVACDKRNFRDDPRLIKSAVGLSLGLEKNGNTHRRNCVPTKLTIPRPKTPFARRSFCIDTLAPPFSVVNKCRDADYPEHWRLMSVYQQSYKNPQKRRNSYRC